MRASRLVSLLLLLQTRGQLTAPELAEELEVSVRTVYRDVEALSSAGVPVYAEAGRGGGFRLIDGYRTRLTGLSAKEAEALLLGGTPGPVGELGLGTVFAAAQAKLLAAMPKEVADRAFVVRQRFHLDSAGWFKSSRVPAHLGPVATAVWEGQRVEVVYRHYDSDEEAKRVLDPLGLVLKAGVWYLVAARDGETRTYRVSRIRSARVLNEESSRPPEFDLPAYWADAVSRFEVGAPRLAVTLRATGRAIAALHRHGCEPEPVERTGRGRVRTSATFDDVDAAVRELMPLGGAVEVLDPPELRDRMREAAGEIVAVYA
ncbi:MAG: YafY family transcriptional regulator [Actinobacteria bacterium]|nr:MAG: YafY family transcriptional regulator [Actinomycetota bacterium]